MNTITAGGESVFRERVAEHYRSKGYRVQQDARVRTTDGSIVPCDLLAEGPLGALVVDFSEDGDGLELGSLRRKAKELGASPVLAAPAFAPALRPLALRAGVVLLDGPALEPGPEAPEPPAAHPWPEPPGDRAGSTEAPPRQEAWQATDVDRLVEDLVQARPPPPERVEAPAAALLWKRGRAPPPAADAAPVRFQWLPRRTQGTATAAPGPPAAPTHAPPPAPAAPVAAGHSRSQAAPPQAAHPPPAPVAAGPAPALAAPPQAAPSTPARVEGTVGPGASAEVADPAPLAAVTPQAPGDADAPAATHDLASHDAPRARRPVRPRPARGLLGLRHVAQAALVGLVSGLVVLGGLLLVLL